VWLRREPLHSSLSYKRLETGVFKLPRIEEGQGSLELRASELAMLLDGIDMARLKRLPRYQRPVNKAEEKVAV
jgi:transposase